MSRRLVKWLPVSLFVALAAFGLAAACGGDDDDDSPPAPSGPAVSQVTIKLKNWAVEPSAGLLAAGKVKFTATHVEEQGSHGSMGMNEGGATHQLYVARLTKGMKSGQGKYGVPVVNLTEIKPGETKVAEVELTPGVYEVACLVVEEVGGKKVDHYKKGMHTLITVK